MDRLGLNHRMTTAWRPSADGQTERMNQVIETYLRAYINYEQNDWVERLPVERIPVREPFSVGLGCALVLRNVDSVITIWIRFSKLSIAIVCS